MRLAVCTLPEGGVITTYTGETGRSFRAGDVVDLDAVAMPADGDRPAVTWADALGEHVEHFASTEPETFTPDTADVDDEEGQE